ncbi:type II toxin-antitoxin system death-on-curing family toxin [Alteromonas antoniana]|uniref:type II toxin-antitoxin system death-on-curing family toxin n=1 Tax=Alteromonas antoniana TaxID=2803813 RepID=UPI001C4664ED|nr:type II toxin-antitoxin system death-on-curing family toxin [Alteromonas antoniana]
MVIIEGIRYLDCDDLIQCNKAALKCTPKERHVVNRVKLEGAQSRPSIYKYYEQCGDVFILAACLFISINKAHAFENANKRTGFLASQVFLQINGYIFSPKLEDTLHIAEQVAIGDRDHNDPVLLSSWFKSYSSLLEDSQKAECLGEQTDCYSDLSPDEPIRLTLRNEP